MAGEDKNANQRSTRAIDAVAGRNLRLIRCLRGYTQEQLGSAVGISFQQVQKYENAKNRMALSRAYEFASVLDVEIDAFLKDAGGAATALLDHPALSDWLALFSKAHDANLISEIAALTSRLLENCESARSTFR